MTRAAGSRLALTERQWQAQVIALAKVLGWGVQFHWRELHSPAGWPDLTLWRTPRNGQPARVLLAELKSAKGVLSEAQERTIEELRQCGLDVRVWRPEDFDAIVAELGGDCGGRADKGGGAAEGGRHGMHG